MNDTEFKEAVISLLRKQKTVILTDKCKKCQTYSAFINSDGLCEDCAPYTIDEQLKEESQQNII